MVSYVHQLQHIEKGKRLVKHQLITTDPAIMMGKPVITGTRITVEAILDRFAAGETIEQVLNAHPYLTREAVFAAFAFAADTLRSDIIYPLCLSNLQH